MSNGSQTITQGHRRELHSGYQLASVIEDRDLAVTAIVRGEDLWASSALQIPLARRLGEPIDIHQPDGY